MSEEWKDIPGAIGYQASSLGRVRSSRKVLSPGLRPDGHTVVGVKGLGTIYTHRAVMLAFVGPRPEGQVILHLNHSPSDNRLSNLRYGTVSENLKMDFAVGARSHKGERAPAAKLSDADVRDIRASTWSANDLADKYKVTPRHIRAVKSGQSREIINRQQGEPTMATKKPALTPAEIKAKKNDLVTLLKQQNEALKPQIAAVKAAEKALAAAKKEADKAVNVASKAHALAAAKAAKAQAAAAKGAEKINAKLAALAPAVPA